MGLPGCLFVCLLILLLVFYLTAQFKRSVNFLSMGYISALTQASVLT